MLHPILQCCRVVGNSDIATCNTQFEGTSGLTAVLLTVEKIRLFFAYPVGMFGAPAGTHDFVIHCKVCEENIPAPVETMPASWIVAHCPLCGEDRRYLPNEVFRGRLSWKLLKKPVQSVGKGVPWAR